VDPIALLTILPTVLQIPFHIWRHRPQTLGPSKLRRCARSGAGAACGALARALCENHAWLV